MAAPMQSQKSLPQCCQMIEWLKQYSLYLVTGGILVAGSRVLSSTYLEEFLGENLVTLLVALLAINTTTASVVMTKLKEISEAHQDASFGSTIAQLRASMREQIALVCLAVVLSILLGSKVVETTFVHGQDVTFWGLATVFSASLGILYDTASSIFVILAFESRP